MATLKKYNLAGDEVGTIEIDEALINVVANPQMIKDYIVALRANQRQWSASTKGRSEVNHSTKKPHRQKGTGLARQGSLAAPQYKGGGVVFGPKPKFDQHVKINQKERRLAVQYLLAEKVKQERLVVVEDKALASSIKEAKTKKVADFLKKHGMVRGKVLFVGEVGKKGAAKEKHGNFKLSMRNIPKTGYALAPNINGYDLMCARHVVMTESAVEELVSLYQESFSTEKGE